MPRSTKRAAATPKANGTAAQPAASKTTSVPVTGPKSLVHRDGRQYDFHPRGEEVAVVATTRYSFTRVVLPREEALYLWNRLRKQGFEQF